MPIPVEALAQMLAGQQPQSIDDLLARPAAPQPWIEKKSKGWLTDERGPPAMPRPNLREQYGVEPEDLGKRANPFPLLPAGDVMDFPKRNFHRPVGPTPNAYPYMLGNRQSPDVRSINPDRQFWDDWIKRLHNRKLIDDMGGLRG